MSLNQLYFNNKEDLCSQLEKLKEKYLQMEKTLDQLSSEKWDMEDTIRKYESERASAQKIKSLTEELNTQNTLVEKLDKEIKFLQNANSNATITINELTESLRLNNIEKTKLIEEKVNQEHLARKLVELTNLNATLAEQNEKYKSEINRAHQELNKLFDLIGQL